MEVDPPLLEGWADRLPLRRSSVQLLQMIEIALLELN